MFKRIGLNCTIFDSILLVLFCYLLYRSCTVGISFYVISFSVLVYFFASKGFKIDRMSGYLFGFSLCYGFFTFATSEQFNPHCLIYFTAPNAFYIWGQRIVRISDSDSGILNFILILLIFFGLYTYYLTIQDIQYVGLVNPTRGMLRSGDVDVSMPATLFGLNVSLGLAGLAICLSLPKPFKSIRFYLFVFVLLLSLLTVVHLTNRTGIIVFIGCSFVVWFYLLPSKKKLSNILVGVIIVLLLILIIYRLFLTDNTGVLDAYTMREQNAGEEIESYGDRGWRWIDALGRLFVFPLGWSGSAPYNYVHNLWLDVAMLFGIVPFAFLLLATIHSLRDTWKLYKIKNNPVVASFIGLTVCFFLSSFVEPVMVGFDVYFYLYCMLWGMQKSYLRG